MEKRISISIGKDLYERMLKAKQDERFCGISWAEMIRILVEEGITSYYKMGK